MAGEADQTPPARLFLRCMPIGARRASAKPLGRPDTPADHTLDAHYIRRPPRPDDHSTPNPSPKRRALRRPRDHQAL